MGGAALVGLGLAQARPDRMVLVITGEQETQLADAESVWRAWARDVRATVVPGGHFIPEEATERLTTALVEFLGDEPRRSTQRGNASWA